MPFSENTSLDAPTRSGAEPGSLPVLQVRGPADLVAAVPYLLGFHPVESLVVVGLADGRVVVTIRVDLDALDNPAPLFQAMASMREGGAQDFLGLVFCDEPPLVEFPYWDVVRLLDQQATALAAPLIDVLLVAEGRFWSYTCRDVSCCPPEGTEVALGESGVAAAATYAGMVALPNRQSLHDLLQPRPVEEREALRPALQAAADTAMAAILDGTGRRHDRSAIRALFAAVRAAEGAPPVLPDDPVQLARLGSALRRVEVRDALWMGVDDGRLRGETLWRHLARVLPSPYDASPLFLLGWGSWRAGSGALAGIAAERALDSDPSYTAAELLIAAVSSAVDPSTVSRLRSRGSGRTPGR